MVKETENINIESLALQEALQMKKMLKQLGKNQLIQIILQLRADFMEQQDLNRHLYEQIKKEEKNESK